MSAPRVSAIVPVKDGRAYLERSLPALLAAGDGLLRELLVVDDGSSDGSGELARELGARVLRTAERASGPACARNLAAESATGELLLFVDADVVPHPDAVARTLAAFDAEDVVAVYGSYDARPAHPGLASRYMNLRHHAGHQRASDDAATFWSGLGAVRRAAFLAVGGFDVARFPHPSVEDIELGRRLRAAGGRIRRCPSIQGTHLKAWSWRQVVFTDLFRRALPWSRLMLRHPGAFDDLNVGAGEKAKAALAALFLASVALALAGSIPAWIALALCAATFLANRALALVFLRGGGLALSLVGTLFHQLHFAYSGAAWLWCRLRYRAQEP